jgi:hypothetical protein
MSSVNLREAPLAKGLYFWVVILLMSSTPVCASNVLDNPGFESGILSPWFQANDFSAGLPKEDWNVTSSEAHSGMFSATNIGNIELRQNFSAVPTETITEVSFWWRHPDGGNTPLAYTLFYSDTSQEVGIATAPTDEYQFIDVTASLDPGKSLNGISVYGFNGAIPGRTFVDDFVIEAVPEPVGIAPFILCVANLVSCYRRRNG